MTAHDATPEVDVLQEASDFGPWDISPDNPARIRIPRSKHVRMIIDCGRPEYARLIVDSVNAALAPKEPEA